MNRNKTFEEVREQVLAVERLSPAKRKEWFSRLRVLDAYCQGCDKQLFDVLATRPVWSIRVWVSAAPHDPAPHEEGTDSQVFFKHFGRDLRPLGRHEKTALGLLDDLEHMAGHWTTSCACRDFGIEPRWLARKLDEVKKGGPQLIVVPR